MTKRYFINLIILLGLLSGCTGMQYVPDDDHLITDLEVDYVDKSLLYNPQKVYQEVYSIIEPQPNSKFLWMRTGIVINGLMPKKEKGIFYFIANEIGAPPALLSKMNEAELIEVINNRLFHLGYFNVSTEIKIDSLKDKKAKVRFIIDSQKPYFIESLESGIDTQNDSLDQLFVSSFDNIQLDSGTYYQLDRIKRARSNIAKNVNNNGYYFFNEEDMEFFVDTLNNENPNSVRLTLNIKPNRRERTLKYYTLDSVIVREDLPPAEFDSSNVRVTKIKPGVYISSAEKEAKYKSKHISRGVFLSPGKEYDRREREKTYRYLSGMGAFNYVDIQLIPETNANKLRPTIGLYSFPRMSFSTEIGVNAKSNNFVGPGLKLTWLNRNIFRGAEQLTISLNGNLERQFGGPPEQRRNSFSYEAGIEAKLRIPRMIPSFINFNRSKYVSFTEFKLGYTQYQRAGLYGIRTAQASGGYQWKGSATEDFYLKPFELNYSSLFAESDEFLDYLDQNPFVRQSFSQQFILGLNLGYSNNQLEEKLDRERFYYTVDFQSAGNVLSLFSSKKNEVDEEFLNVPYAQFVRLTQEYRKYFSVGKKGNDLATRILLGIGYPYGNSRSLPYVRQYFSGGPNSLRGFRARTIGPGTYVNTSDQLIYVDQTGDIRFEINAEYRKKLATYFEGAFFIDAGNIWLFNEDPDRPGANFEFKDFYKEIAISGGAGLRINLSVIVIRFDLAFPLRKPIDDTGFEWVFSDINPFKKDWRRDNLILNFSIGYPF
ncbi:translocation and assembly module lipoprotein TamL [Marinigracilibium pacificum]|uniref:BamA/TamA family outer membrane protein n=1 Tax=Marinigracilibium pacificum TaxID=2729599 RepID=A0A848J3F4_9BACT|nr:BamA/TamA family outer membrane protein [Marinigracilibium pacificum]NMM49858.1 BamA/TamA family outer membrane protein [Marinigracilibium pacificum]